MSNFLDTAELFMVERFNEDEPTKAMLNDPMVLDILLHEKMDNLDVEQKKNLLSLIDTI